MKNRPVVGVLSRHPISDADGMSGTPNKVFHALKEIGLNVVDISPKAEFEKNPVFLVRCQRKLRGILERIRNRVLTSEGWYRKHIDNATNLSLIAQERIARAKVDVIVGVCISTMIYKLDSKCPIIYASDTTAALLNNTYDNFSKRPVGYRRACNHIEQQALDKCSYFLPAAERTLDSAIKDYDIDPQKIRLIEFGAHVLPVDENEVRVEAPSKENLELVLVAADPIRKRLKFCIEVVKTLNDMGWNAKLNYIGPADPALANNGDFVRHYGRLKLSEEADQKIHRQVLSRSHWMILPSKAEAFGIAPCEAAHFGSPSIVSNVGGLPTVVRGGETGIVMNEQATPSDYAIKITEISQNESCYLEMANAALKRGRDVLSWSIWARKVKQLIDEELNRN